MIGRASGIERDFALLRVGTCRARSTGFARDDRASCMILIASGWQKGPSQILPPSCRYQPSCSAYAITAIERYGAARGRLAGAEAHLPLPPVGRPRPRPGTCEDLTQ